MDDNGLRMLDRRRHGGMKGGVDIRGHNWRAVCDNGRTVFPSSCAEAIRTGRREARGARGSFGVVSIVVFYHGGDNKRGSRGTGKAVGGEGAIFLA